jgi:pimeloyl-ACP methyl ester carboxylesterase
MVNETTPAATAVIFPTLWSGPWLWRNQQDILAAAAGQVVEIPDAVVNWPIEPTLEAAEAYALDAIDRLPVPLLLVGASLGGLLALRIALLRPQLVGAVIASGCPGLTQGPAHGLRAKFSLTFEDACSVRAMLFQDTSCVDDELLRASVAAVANRPAARRGAGLVRSLNRYDGVADLQRLRVPATLIWGERDQLSPVVPWRDLVRLCPAMRLRVIPEAGHVPMLEVPEAFNAQLRSAITASLLTPQAEQPSMETIKTYPTNLEADLARIALEAAGIPATVVGIGVGMEGGLGGVKLLVPREHVEAALRILADA